MVKPVREILEPLLQKSRVALSSIWSCVPAPKANATPKSKVEERSTLRVTEARSGAEGMVRPGLDETLPCRILYDGEKGWFTWKKRVLPLDTSVKCEIR